MKSKDTDSPKISSYNNIFGEDDYDIAVDDIKSYYTVIELENLLIDITDADQLPD